MKKINYLKLNVLVLMLSTFGCFENNLFANPNIKKWSSGKERSLETNKNLNFNPLKLFPKKKNTSEFSSETSILSGKYTVNYRINTKCNVINYYKNAQIIFFPILELNSDGSLLNNYQQTYDSNSTSIIFSSDFNIHSTIKSIADRFITNFDFKKSPLLFSFPEGLKECYFIRFYYYVNSEPITHNSVYLKSSIEYINYFEESQEPSSVWVGEASYDFSKGIAKSTFLDVAIRMVFEYAFKNHTHNGKFNILDM